MQIAIFYNGEILAKLEYQSPYTMQRPVEVPVSVWNKIIFWSTSWDREDGSCGVFSWKWLI